ncbi:hypothetical protein ACVWXU_001895 [Streptomyces sp. TE33382]
MSRGVLTGAQWVRLEAVLPPTPKMGRPRRDRRGLVAGPDRLALAGPVRASRTLGDGVCGVPAVADRRNMGPRPEEVAGQGRHRRDHRVGSLGRLHRLPGRTACRRGRKEVLTIRAGRVRTASRRPMGSRAPVRRRPAPGAHTSSAVSSSQGNVAAVHRELTARGDGGEGDPPPSSPTLHRAIRRDLTPGERAGPAGGERGTDSVTGCEGSCGTVLVGAGQGSREWGRKPCCAEVLGIAAAGGCCRGVIHALRSGGEI